MTSYIYMLSLNLISREFLGYCQETKCDDDDDHMPTIIAAYANHYSLLLTQKIM